MKLKISLLFISLMMITSCVSNSQIIDIPKNENLPNTVSENPRMDDWTIRIDFENLQTLNQSSQYFLMYLGNPTCSSCLRFQPNLLGWIDETNALVYYLDTLENLHQLTTIQSQFPNYFPEGFSTPSLYIFLGESRVHRIWASEAFFSYPRFKALMSSYVRIEP